MTFYGATVIHPKTIKPLKNLNIPLFVKPFLYPDEPGTVIKENATVCTDHPAIIVKQHQVLVSFFTKNFSFITEDHLSGIFKVFANVNIKINMMQNSALSFSVCFDWDDARFNLLRKHLDDDFKIKFNQNLQLITVRHHNKEILAFLSVGKIILLEQLSRNTAQLVLKEIEL